MRKTKGFANLLFQMGLLTRRKVLKQYIYGLTKLGASYVGCEAFDIRKIAPSRVDHALSAQEETLTAIARFGVIDFEFEVKIDWLERSDVENMRTDVFWERGFKTDFLVEIELSAKNISNGELDRFFLKITCHPTIVVFNDRIIMERYLKAAKHYFKHGLPLWYQNENKWYKENNVQHLGMLEWGRCYFKMLGDEETELKSLAYYIEPDHTKHINENHYLKKSSNSSSTLVFI